MDGLWSSPDLVGLLRWAALNREALALLGRLVAASRSSCAGPSRTALRRNTKRRQPPQHRRPLRPRQRLLPAVPRRDDDLLERGLRRARPVARRRPAQQVPAHRRAAPGSTAASTCSRSGPGWGGFALYAAGELGCRVTTITISQEQHDLARERVRAAGLERPRRRPAARLPRHRPARTTPIVSIEMLEAVGAEYFETFFEACDRGARARRAAEPPVDHLPGRRVRAAASAARTGSRRTSSRAACARRWPSSSGRPRGHAPARSASVDGHRGRLRADAARVADAVPGAARRRCARMGFDDRFMRMWEYYLASERGRVRHRHQPGPADRLREAARARGRRRRPDPGPACPATIRLMDRLRERVVLITGSTGIAAATAVRCAAEGAPCSSCRATADHARALAERIAAIGAAVGWAAADLAEQAAVDARGRRLRRAVRADRRRCSRWPAAAAGGSATARSTS